MKRLVLFTLLALTTACASTTGTSSSSSSALCPPSSIGGPVGTPLAKPALDLFAAAAQLTQPGITLSIDLDALTERGLRKAPMDLQGGYTLVQTIAPFTRELAMLSSSLIKPLSETLVYATLLDRRIPASRIKRLGFFFQGEDFDDLDFDEIVKKGVLLLGLDMGSAEAQALLADYAAIARAAQPALDEILIAEDETPVAFVLAPQGDALCAIDQESKEAVACLLGSEGIYALGSPSLIEVLKARVPAAASVPQPPHFVRFSILDPGAPRIELIVDGKTDLDVSVSIEAPDEESAEQVAMASTLFLSSRDQAKREFDMATALSLQNAQRAIASDEKASASLKALASGLTLESIYDPYATGLISPDPLTLTQRGNHFLLKLHLPAAYVDHLIVTGRQGTILDVFQMASSLEKVVKLVFD
ncbi:MAG: hypothetical protein LBM75_05375 [Myxococcales bacterium]|jgi:hypothetical protein|nr:hypothetical protein [Myxococcales bacterium]